MFLPDIGTLLLNGKALDATFGDGGIALATGRNFDTQDNNPAKLCQAFKRGNGWTLNSKEQLSSDFVFVRARNNEFNYSENPSFISGSTGAVIFDSFVDNPTTYITTVGMYNVNNELLAVAKLSRPLPKDFTKELLVRVKLDF
jgi:UDP-N-acetylmuramyl tripeptide synthase